MNKEVRSPALCWLAVTLVAVGGQTAMAQDPTSVELRAAIRMEVVDGDLEGAIQLYEYVAQQRDRSSAALALERMGACYEKLGDRDAAVRTYSRLIDRFADQKDAIAEARKRLALLPASSVTTGWYNGDWRSGVPGIANWFRSRADFSRIYDDFVVPEGGWTVVAVFSNNRTEFDQVTQSSWEIRSAMNSGAHGKLVASGLAHAAQTRIPGEGPFPGDPLAGYRIEVDGLRVFLPPGRYWLSVAPVVPLGERCYISATLGNNAIGLPVGDHQPTYLDRSTPDRRYPVVAETIGLRGQLGVARNFSQGLLILNPSRQ